MDNTIHTKRDTGLSKNGDTYPYTSAYISDGESYPINQSDSETEKTVDAMNDVNAYIEIIKENIEYDHYMKYGDKQNRELYDELFEIIREVVCVKHRTVRIGGDEYPYELVKAKYLKLNSSHLNYVIDRMKNTTTKIANIKAYMVTTLYNAPNTINHSQEKLVQVLSYLLRIGEYKTFAGKTIGNNVYMDIKWKKVVFKRTRLAYERNNIFVTIKRLAKKYKPDFDGKVYLETVRCYFTTSEEELKKCRYNYKGKYTYAFVLSDKYIRALYTHCLLARKAAAFENIELNGLSKVELSMVKLESVREVLFQALLLDDGKMYAEFCTIVCI